MAKVHGTAECTVAWATVAQLGLDFMLQKDLCRTVAQALLGRAGAEVPTALWLRSCRKLQHTWF